MRTDTIRLAIVFGFNELKGLPCSFRARLASVGGPRVCFQVLPQHLGGFRVALQGVKAEALVADF